MPAPVVYVESGKFSVGKVFDNKLKTKVAAMMKDATEKAIKEQKAFTTDKKKAAGKEYVIGGTVTEVACDGEGAKAVLSITISPLVTGKGGKIAKLAMKASGKLGGVNPKKIESDVEALIDAVWRKDFMKKAAAILPSL
jgi:hypothetical protein